MPGPVSAAESAPAIHGGDRRPIIQIQWLRGLAASLVMLLHSGDFGGTPLHPAVNIFPLAFGYLGVGLFFAISGYLMSVAVRMQQPTVFLAHRVVRIYPLLIVVTLAFGLVAPHLGFARRIDFRALALMPVPGLNPYFFVEWTLIFEVAFYAALYLVAVAGLARHITLVGLAWMAAIVGCGIFFPFISARLLMPYQQLLASPVSLPMAGGLLLPWLLRSRLPAWLPGLLGIATCLIAGHYTQDYNASRLIYGTGAVLLLWAALAIPQDSRLLKAGLAGRCLSRWGDYSYGLYLCHGAVIALVYGWCAGLPFWQAWCLAIVVASTASIAIGRFDIRLYAWMKRSVRRMDSRSLQRIVAAYAVAYLVVSVCGAVRYHVRDREQVEGLMGAMQLQAPIRTLADADAAARQAGWRPNAHIVGNVDAVYRDDAEAHLFVGLWAADVPAGQLHLHVALFRNGQFLGVVAADTARKDIARQLHLIQPVNAGFHFERAGDACDPHPIVAIAFTSDGQYSVLPNQVPPLACAASVGERAP